MDLTKVLSKIDKKTLMLSAFFCSLLIIAFLSSYCGLNIWATVRYKVFWERQIPRELAKTKYISVVVISEQRNYIFRKGWFSKRYTITTGSKLRYNEDRQLRPGVWRLSRRIYYSKDQPIFGPRVIYIEYYNPYKREFIPTEKAFHGTSEEENLGNPTSMGCVYHHNKDIVEIYDTLPDNTLIIATLS